MLVLQIYHNIPINLGEKSIYKDYLFKNCIPQKDYGDEQINTLMDVLKEIIAYMPDIISSNIDQALKENNECLAFDSTYIEHSERNWYIMKRWIWSKDSIEVLIMRENFIEIFQAWQQYQKNKPNFIIISRDGNYYSISSAESV